MAIPKQTHWPLEPHTRVKHEILRLYLHSWFPMLSKFNVGINYIDGFSGPGRYENGEDGSPIIALKAAIDNEKFINNHIHFQFIEQDAGRLENLRQEVNALNLPDRFTVSCISGTFENVIRDSLGSLEPYSETPAPTFAFIDPFGFSGIPFYIIDRFLRFRGCEVLINFMVDPINRWIQSPDQQVVQHIVDLFGCKDAVQVANNATNRKNALRDLYQDRLCTVAKHVRYFEMKDRRNRTQYYLFFASNHRKGHIRMKEAMWRMDPKGEFRFSDATNPNQQVLFEMDSTPALAEELRSVFTGKGQIPGHCVKHYVEDKTPYLKMHMDKALRQEEAAGRIVVAKTKVDGKKRRANTYPDDILLEFVEVLQGNLLS